MGQSRQTARSAEPGDAEPWSLLGLGARGPATHLVGRSCSRRERLVRRASTSFGGNRERAARTSGGTCARRMQGGRSAIAASNWRALLVAKRRHVGDVLRSPGGALVLDQRAAPDHRYLAALERGVKRTGTPPRACPASAIPARLKLSMVSRVANEMASPPLTGVKSSSGWPSRDLCMTIILARSVARSRRASSSTVTPQA